MTGKRRFIKTVSILLLVATLLQLAAPMTQAQTNRCWSTSERRYYAEGQQSRQAARDGQVCSNGKWIRTTDPYGSRTTSGEDVQPTDTYGRTNWIDDLRIDIDWSDGPDDNTTYVVLAISALPAGQQTVATIRISQFLAAAVVTAGFWDWLSQRSITSTNIPARVREMIISGEINTPQIRTNAVSLPPGKEVYLPPEVPGFDPPDHISNHPRGDYQATVKKAVWNMVFTEWATNGRPPDWCGQRESDGAVAVVFYKLIVKKTTGGLYKGLAIVLNGNTGPSTAEWGIQLNGDGRPKNGSMKGFETYPCPPPFKPAY